MQMQRYEFVLNNGQTVDVIEDTMVGAINRFKRMYGDMEHVEVREYCAGVHVGGIEKVGDKWAVYVIE
jgi:hypothetical protein